MVCRVCGEHSTFHSNIGWLCNACWQILKPLFEAQADTLKRVNQAIKEGKCPHTGEKSPLQGGGVSCNSCGESYV